jgi:hypothetical protein
MMHLIMCLNIITMWLCFRGYLCSFWYMEFVILYWTSFSSYTGRGEKDLYRKNVMQHLTFSFSLGERLSGGPFSVVDVWRVDFFPDRFVVISPTFEYLTPFSSCMNACISTLKMTTNQNQSPNKAASDFTQSWDPYFIIYCRGVSYFYGIHSTAV